MKVGKMVKEVPALPGNNPGKYRPLWEQAEKLKKGEFLPVEFESSKEAMRFYRAAWQAAHRDKNPRKIRNAVCGNTVYLSRAE